MKHALKRLAAATLLAGLTAPVLASHATVFNPIDGIDHVFAAGGGSTSVTTTSGADDAWLVFAANAGDVLTITATGIFGPNIVLFRETENGIVEVGDIYTASGSFDGNSDQTGTGTELTVTSFRFDAVCSGDCYVAPDSASFTVLTSGQYVIGVSPANESSGFAGTSGIELSGNTGTVGAPVPAPASALLALLALGGVAATRRRG